MNQDCEWDENDSWTKTVCTPLDCIFPPWGNSGYFYCTAEPSDHPRATVRPNDDPKPYSNDISNSFETVINQMTSESILSYTYIVPRSEETLRVVDLLILWRQIYVKADITS